MIAKKFYSPPALIAALIARGTSGNNFDNFKNAFMTSLEFYNHINVDDYKNQGMLCILNEASLEDWS